jgi:hypothetical protein
MWQGLIADIPPEWARYGTQIKALNLLDSTENLVIPEISTNKPTVPPTDYVIRLGGWFNPKW